MTNILASLQILTLLFISCKCKSIFVINAEETDELVSVVVLYRHGDRAPISSYPNDPYYDVSYWPEGYGQLLNKGKERQYELGMWFRQRYNGFLSEEYSPNEIRVVSTDVDRTLTSAASNLAGLYPPPDSQIWNEDLLWEPIPIHTTALENDEILAMEKACPKFDRLFKDVKNSDYFKNFSIENKELFDYISNHTGYDVVTLDTIRGLYTVLYVYQNHNTSYIPAWADKLDQEKFTYLAGLGFATATLTDELKRLEVGPFFNYLINYFDNVVANDSDTPKFLMLSGHDTTIASVLDGMGVYDNWPPGFASTVLWELRKTNSGTFYINLFYKKDITDTPEELTVDGCDFNCAYDDFKNNLETITINTTNWIEECQSNAPQLKSYWVFPSLIVIIITSIVQ